MKQFFILASTFIFASCVDIERGNPEDPGSRNYNVNRLSSSLSVEVSSSSEPSSSSSSVPQSSSSVVQSSSSVVESSSSMMVSSSSSTLPSSSSVEVSSSSLGISSSSSSSPIALSSSSLELSSSSSSPVASSSSAMDGGSSSSGGGGITSGTFIDDRDNKPYKWVKIGKQVWMAENLNYDVPDNNNDVCYKNDPANCVTYGRLYNWATAMANVCPSGWHLPSDADWDALMTAVGGSSTAGKHLKAKEGWNSCGPSGSGKTYSCEDTYGFSALPGGLFDGSSNVGYIGYWWSASDDISRNAHFRYMHYFDDGAIYSGGDKYYLYSVRCLQN